MKSSRNNPLEGMVHVDEFEIGIPKKREHGRSASDNKKRVVLVVEERWEI